MPASPLFTSLSDGLVPSVPTLPALPDSHEGQLVSPLHSSFSHFQPASRAGKRVSSWTSPNKMFRQEPNNHAATTELAKVGVGGQRLSPPSPYSLSDCTPSWEPLPSETGLSLVSSESSFTLD